MRVMSLRSSIRPKRLRHAAALLGGDPQLVALARLPLGRHHADRQRARCQIDRQQEGRRHVVLLEHGDVARWHLRPHHLAHADHHQQAGRDRRSRSRQVAPAPHALLQLDDLSGATCLGQPRLDPGEQARRGLERGNGLGQRRQAALPRPDRRVEVALALAPRRHGRALGRIERSQRVLGRQTVDVLPLVHVPRQSLSCARLRRSQVLMVGTGRL